MPNPSDQPRTLLDIVGAPSSPPPLADSTLVMVDFQYEYLDGRLALPGFEAAVASAVELLELCRAAGVPVVHIAHKGGSGGLFDRQAKAGQIVEAVAPVADEQTIEKTLPNAFAGTTLDQSLRELGRPAIVVAGFMTHMCVSSTVRAALDLGYRSTVVAAATATRDLPAAGGAGIVDAQALQQASLAAMADRFAIVVESVGKLA